MDNLAIIAEIDYCHWCLETMAVSEKRLSLIERMIDEATGFDKSKLLDAKRLIRRTNLLKRRLAKMHQEAAL